MHFIRGPHFWLSLIASMALAASSEPPKRASLSSADVPKELLQVVPEKYQKRTFDLRWLEGLPESIARGDWKQVDPRTNSQCLAFENAMIQMAADRPAAQFPMTLQGARAAPEMLWAPDALSQKAMTFEQLRQLGNVAILDPSTKPLPKIFDSQWFMSSSGLSIDPTRYPPGSVVTIELPFAGKLEHPFSKGVLVGCVLASANLKFTDGMAKAESMGQSSSFSHTYIYWRKGEVTKELPVWWGLWNQAQSALIAYARKYGKAPEKLDDLESVFGKRNKKAWTPAMERIVNEYYIPRLKAALVAH